MGERTYIIIDRTNIETKKFREVISQTITMCTHRNSPYHKTLVHPCYQLSTSNNHSLPVEVPGVFLHTIYIPHPCLKKVVQIKNVNI